MRLPFLRLEYDDADPATYEGISLLMLDDKKPELFNTGNPTVDYHTAMAVIYKRAKDAGVDIDDVPIQGSSSIDHFVMDGGELRDSEPTDEDIQQAIVNAKKHLGIDTEGTPA